jgi:tetratricopeptide (TPR) repeat protein
LRALNLVVIKRRPGESELLELHPMVRQFVQRNFQVKDRISFIVSIIKVYKRFIGSHKVHLTERPSFSVLQYWTQNAELDITAGKFSDAFTTLAEVADAFDSSAYAREFCRVARALLSSADWVTNHSNFKNFEHVFETQVDLLSNLGEYGEVDTLLEKYGQTVPNKDARYINYCKLMCKSRWIRGDFGDAVTWGKRGQDLQEKSGVDTKYDVSHELALAERDAGQPEFALTYFLQGRTLAEVVDPEELEDARGGAYYGNIGRCLHFMGQIDAALVCYQKSALLIERDPIREHLLNQGYIRAWIGELLAARELYRLGYVFFRAAYLKWEQIAPPKALKVLQLSREIEARIGDAALPDNREVENICVDWILGRSLDSQFR